jgi:hypothetical protein
LKSGLARRAYDPAMLPQLRERSLTSALRAL